MEVMIRYDRKKGFLRQSMWWKKGIFKANDMMEKLRFHPFDVIWIFYRFSLILAYFRGNTSRPNLQWSQASSLDAKITFSFGPNVDLDMNFPFSVFNMIFVGGSLGKSKTCFICTLQVFMSFSSKSILNLQDSSIDVLNTLIKSRFNLTFGYLKTEFHI